MIGISSVCATTAALTHEGLMVGSLGKVEGLLIISMAKHKLSELIVLLQEFGKHVGDDDRIDVVIVMAIAEKVYKNIKVA